MATLTLDTISPRPSLLDRLLDERRPQPQPQSRPASPAVAADRSLDDLVTTTWNEVASADAACLVCGGTLTPRYGAGPKPVAARCGDCGSELG